MEHAQIRQSAALLQQSTDSGIRMSELPVELRPQTRSHGYLIQSEFVRNTSQNRVGWKIAATSLAGQKHIGVDGPLAGQLLANRVCKNGATISLAQNLMLVAEAEFVFRFEKALPSRLHPYSQDEVLDAVGSMHVGIEIPDSRFEQFEKVGTPQLIADNACASWYVLNDTEITEWQSFDLPNHQVYGYKNGALAATGIGSNVLGDPRLALTWLVNEVSAQGFGINVGEFVTTGTCLSPIPITRGDKLLMDFGQLGTVSANCL